jgi:hypothetical protein
MQRSVSTTTHFLGLTINKNPYKKRQEQKKIPNIYKRRKKYESRTDQKET